VYWGVPAVGRPATGAFETDFPDGDSPAVGSKDECGTAFGTDGACAVTPCASIAGAGAVPLLVTFGGATDGEVGAAGGFGIV
jgi:hypothetical protein